MIEGDRDSGYTLSCDMCGEEADCNFDTFEEAVEWKKDKRNGWVSRKNHKGVWFELCGGCAPSWRQNYEG